jgi:superfamily I DNA/RNA helicase/Txe/YoeB family toxin of Txe-Axe toxin-antitoxin module
MAQYNFSINREFYEDLNKLPQEVQQRTNRALNRMMEDPWAKELHPEKVKSAEAGVHSCRVDDKFRVIWKHIKPNDILFCLVDIHDVAYQRATRKSFILEDGMLKVADITEVGAKRVEATGGLFNWMRSKNEKIGALFVGYRDQELLDLGVPTDVLVNVRALEDVEQLPDIERLLSVETYNRLLEIALGVVERPTVKDEELHASLEYHQGGDELYRFVSSEEFKRALAGDMEEWMLFLAAPQRYLATRNYNGPARLKGVAGSGKTVIAIHRARQLARQAQKNGKRILFVTYGNRLPGVVAYLLNRLVGEDSSELGAIECRSIHQWCSQFLAEQGIALRVDERIQDNALSTAIEQVRPKYNDLRLLSRSVTFFEDEIRYVLKGKEIRNLDEYLTLDRSGRGTALQARERQAMFEIYQAYQTQLLEQGCCDWDDFILQTLEFLEKGDYSSPYQAAIVDELQDLTEATLHLIRLLVPPGPDDLFLVGDGLQRIYPGGVSFRKIDIDVTGRGALLRRNYRNTQEILRAAHAVIRENRFDDLEDEPAEVEEPEYSLRRGELPLLERFNIPEQEIDWVGTEIRRLNDQAGYKPEEIAILYRWRKPYHELIESRLQSFEPVVLDRDPFTYFGPGLKHTTFHSAKGLEFKVVFVVGVTDGQMVPRDSWSLQGEELEDYLARERRLLYVAMTRARDLLYVTSARGMFSRFLNTIPPKYIRHRK